ncbi:MAG: radical SAM protein, partial [bacterium]
SEPPHEEDGVLCTICLNRCRMREGSIGYCGLRTNRGGKLTHLGGRQDLGKVSWYHDPVPTNCVASWVCPAGSGAGYPDFSYDSGPEFGHTNLAVFYEACTFDCLFCQNYHFRERTSSPGTRTAEQLADAVDDRTACICYFGGDPTPQLFHALKASEMALAQNGDRILRICWETNGSMNPSLLKKMADLSMRSGGCIKFDLKFFEERLNIALCGVSNRQTLENFERLARHTRQRPDPPFLIASTLLVPGYVDAKEVGKIATFIASLNPDIPYSLLAFYPHFYMPDLPTTSHRHAEECEAAAKEAGLTRVRIGNMHLLSDAY